MQLNVIESNSFVFQCCGNILYTVQVLFQVRFSRNLYGIGSRLFSCTIFEQFVSQLALDF